MNIIASNVSDISQARVLVLLGDHEGSPAYYRHCQTIQERIKQLYNPNDIILVEDPWNKRKAELAASHIPDLARDAYNIEGWDDEEACQQAEEVGRFACMVQEAVNQVRSRQSEDHYATLLRLASPIFGTPKNDVEKSRFLTLCEEYYLNSAESFAISRFDVRNERAIKQTAHHLASGKRRVILTMGPEHATSNYEHVKPTCQRLIQALSRFRFMILQ